MKQVGIGLFGKGSINHLHRDEIIQSLVDRQFAITFIVENSFIDLLEKNDNCSYTSCTINEYTGLVKDIVDTCRTIRWLYPGYEPARRLRLFKGLMPKASFIGRIFLYLYSLIATFIPSIKLLSKIELLFIKPAVLDLNLDLLILSGVGCRPPDGVQELSKWAKLKNVEVVYVAGNYDSLSTRGFKGVDVRHLLVWGEHMVDDATRLHDIPRERVQIIGPIRYDYIETIKQKTNPDFLTEHNLDNDKKTILFAGSTYPFHYIEMLSIFKLLCEERDDLQLVVRVYPNKFLRNSPYLPIIESYAKELGCFVSHGDVFKKDIYPGNQDVLWVEEYELFNFIKFSDVVINIFSTLAIEALMFDKPTIYMNYQEDLFQKHILSHPTYLPYEIYPPLKRLISYNAIDIAKERSELMELIKNNIDNDSERPERKKLILSECGKLDGKASSRLANYCSSIL